MANPAELLHQILEEWSRNKSSYADPTQQRLATRHLDAIEELLDQMDAADLKTAVYRRHFDKWVTLTLHHPHEWQKQASQQIIDVTALEHLDNLADWFKQLVPTVTPDGLTNLREYAEGTRQIVDEDESIDPLLKHYAGRVIDNLLWCIDHYEIVGDFDVREAVNRLIATMTNLASRSTHRDRWRAWMNRYKDPFVVNMVSAIPAQALIQLALGG